MKYIYILIFYLFTVLSTVAQNPNNHWKLGASDVDFSTNPPIVSNVSGWGYGLASISDDNGDLLFYTDGLNVWGKNHMIMTNGIIGSSANPVNKVIIVPNVSNPSQYYIFKSQEYSCLCSTPNPQLYLYSIVEFNSSFPFGTVLSINTSINPDTPENEYSKCLKDNSGTIVRNSAKFGPLVATKNNTGDALWVVAQSGNKILSFKIDNSGLNQIPIVSTFTNAQIYNLGVQYSNSFDGIEGAEFRLTNDNTKLVGLQYSILRGNNDADNDPAYSDNIFYKLNFNAQTGVFSNYLLLFQEQAITSFEIANSSSNLYFIRAYKSAGVPYSKGEVVVRDINNLSNPSRILNLSGSAVASSSFSYLQRDKNGEILISSLFSTSNRNLYIHKIENQNSYTASTVLLNFLSLNNTINVMPQLIPSFEEPCFDDVLVTSTVFFGTDKKQAVNRLTASNIINSNTGAIYHAGTSVKLSNGFHAKAGSKFRAYIEGCSGEYAARVANVEDKEQEISENKAKENIFKLFPNPNKGIFEISAKEAINEKLQIQIYSIYGELMQSKIIDATSITKDFDISNAPAGIYFVKITGTNFNEEIKFVKE